MAAATVLRHFSPISSSLKQPSRHRRFLHHNLFPKIPLPSSLIKFGAENSEPQPPPPLPEADCPVPPEQQPINEYQSLSTSFPFSWASGDLLEYSSRLFVTGASFAFFVGLPVSWFGSVGPEYEPVKRILAASSSGIFVVTLAVVRMYLGWAYVGNRLLSATVECMFYFSFYFSTLPILETSETNMIYIGVFVVEFGLISSTLVLKHSDHEILRNL